MSKSILITGGAGFIGSNFVPYFTQKYPEYEIINLDKLTYAGNLDNLKECESMPNYTFVKGDICDRELIEKLFTENDIRGVIHFAAESHVDNSIKNPGAFIKTNIEGTFTLIDIAFRHWMEGPNKVKKGYEKCRFHHISTDEVYGVWVCTAFLRKRHLMRQTAPIPPVRPVRILSFGHIIILSE